MLMKTEKTVGKKRILSSRNDDVHVETCASEAITLTNCQLEDEFDRPVRRRTLTL